MIKDLLIGLIGLIIGFLLSYLVNNIFKEIEDAKVLKNTLDKFEAYLRDLSDALDCMLKESADQFSFLRLRDLLLDEKTRDIAQILNAARITELFGNAISIVVRLEEKFRFSNNFDEVELNKMEVWQYRKEIFNERQALIQYRNRIEIPKFHECESFKIALGMFGLSLIIIAIVAIQLSS